VRLCEQRAETERARADQARPRQPHPCQSLGEMLQLLPQRIRMDGGPSSWAAGGFSW
jgi:hypothetical protein